MKKIGAFVVLFLLLFSIAPAFAADGDAGTDCGSTPDCNTGLICEDEVCVIDPDADTAEDTTPDTTADTTTTTTTTSPQDDSDKIALGFECLEEKAGDCSSLSVQEMAFTILATPDNIFDDCVDELESKETDGNWGNIKDTAMAILALKHAGKDTADAEEWLIAQNRTPTDLTWYLEQDSNEASECKISYDAEGYNVNVGENKKIDSNAGPCLVRAQSNFWLQVSPDCFDKEFSIECDKDFISTLLYKNQQSSTIYVLEGTDSAPAFGSIKLDVKSKCFGSSSSCDYESTAWATIALLETGYNVEEYIPYIIAMSDTNERYLPEAFVYALTNYDDYATQLIANQKLGNYWEAKNTANNKFYDTSLALMALGSSSSAEQVTKARDWLLFSQGTNGCWQNSVKETAIVLWALTGRAGRSSGGGSGSGVTYCSEASYFCIPTTECPSAEDVGNNYFCASLSDTCCTDENLKSCSEYNGQQCTSEKVCIGNSRRAVDALGGDCCTGLCEDRPTESECEQNLYTCMSSCSEFQESVPSYSCDDQGVCCRTKTGDGDGSEGSSLWIWILIILILLVIGAIAWVKREELKVYAFKLKSKFKKDNGKGGPAPAGMRPGPRGPPRPPRPRPGFPPVRRAAPPVAPVRRRGTDRRDTAMSETFKKLRDMSS